MMGHREKIKGGDEQDCFTKWRHVMCHLHHPRVKHNIKKKFSRRVRKEAKQQAYSESGAATLVVKRGSPLEIAMFEANQVADELANRARRDTADAKRAVIALQSLLSQKLGFKLD
ncbi:hypothetical protein I6F26_21015 [Ensifer sp. IC3342]|nr:hypothetical protein [Ensifer sp. BRP08]MCA1449060.1 hypothetical protein [Ensifer sp. IC3342]